MARAVLSERQLTVLRWVGEQYAAPLSTVADLLRRDGLAEASAEVVARRVAVALERLGYADRRAVLGSAWLVPTRAGLRAAGLPYRMWNPDHHEWSAKHIDACGRLRLHLAECYPEARWESDRAIRQRWHGSGARVRLADGGLYWPDGDAVGVELERYVKRPSRYRSAVLDVDQAWSAGVWWFTPANLAPLLTARLREAGGGEVHQVYELPEGVAP
jgi:hypothetical protein